MKKWLNSNYSAINHHGGCQVKGGLGQGDLIWTRLLQSCIYSLPSGLSHYHYVPLSRKRRQLFFFSFHKATVFPIACRVLDDICTKFHKCTIMHLSAKNWHIQPISIYVFICHPTMLPLVTDYSVEVKTNSTPVHRFCFPLKQAGINVSFLSLGQLAKLR